MLFSRGFIVFFMMGMGGIVLAAPRLELDQTSIHVGTYPANQPQSLEFKITNIGDETLKITKVGSTCGCAAGVMEKSELQPGDSASVTVNLIPESIAGPFSKALFIHSNDPAKPIASVTVGGQAIPLAVVLPQNYIYAGTVPVNRTYTQEYLLKTTEPVEWGEPVISGSANRTTVVLTPLEAAPGETDREYSVKVTFTPKQVEDTFKVTVQLPINAPENWKPVELLLQGRVSE